MEERIYSQLQNMTTNTEGNIDQQKVKSSNRIFS
jgi:hypothetical protein